ncbi:YkgJ family cysteine cluster protein [Pseudomonas sp. HR96]|uniref:YkgJ family cysteine cluster protein n=1 Tax=Pseudomonas sp. HR96 TaxID=1027966 RepID=UPI002A7650D3|nr:YkgJ family cysteine cluster protein [Pseudomonas sp. HR96]WPO98609.1 YkgJ family cysteine cluster protein [Pseudomonas sp. HR96]
MNCREGCGACCIAPSISSPIPGMPDGKPAGVRCVQLSPGNLCQLFGLPERPAVCGQFQADPDVCGASDEQALSLLTWWEQATAVA